MEFKALIGSYAEQFQIGDIVPDEEGVVRLNADGIGISLKPTPDGESAQIRVRVGDLPADRGELMMRMMEAMFLGRRTGSSVFVVKPGCDTCFLQQTLPLARIGLDELDLELGKMVDLAEICESVIAEGRKETQWN